VTLGILAILLASFLGRGAVAVQPADLAFGREQVEKFIQDRPAAGVIINRNRALKEQLAILFADDGQGDNDRVERVFWDSKEPVSYPAEHWWSASSNKPTSVRVSRRSELSAIDKCAWLVFELHNARFDRRFKALALMAANKQISRNDYARSVVHTEFEAFKKAKEFLLKYPLGDTNSAENPDYAEIMQTPEDFSAYLQQLAKSKSGMLDGYRKQYDEILSRANVKPLDVR